MVDTAFVAQSPDGDLLDGEAAPGLGDAEPPIAVDDALTCHGVAQAPTFRPVRRLCRQTRRQADQLVVWIFETRQRREVGVKEARIVGGIVREEAERRVGVEPCRLRRRREALVDKGTADEAAMARDDQSEKLRRF